MKMTTQQKHGEMAISSKQLEDLIQNAIRKVGGKKENDICKYLPMQSGGYMHHFTMRKMKKQLPEKLSEMIKTYIITPSKPATVTPKQRAARGSRKRKDHIVLTKSDIDRILQMARQANDKELIRKLAPRKDFKAIKRELLSLIRNNRVDEELWVSYVETVSTQNA
jgi:hypothetical protein